MESDTFSAEKVQKHEKEQPELYKTTSSLSKTHFYGDLLKKSSTK